MSSMGEKKDDTLLLEDYITAPDRADGEKNNTQYNNEDRLEEWRVDLTKLEYEIQTLKSVLAAKHREANELRRKLGITQMSEIKQDLQYGLQAVRESNAFQKTSSVFKNFGSFATQKVGNLRNTVAFKSVEGKMGNAYTSVRTKLKPSKSTDGYERELDDKVDPLSDPLGTLNDPLASPAHPHDTPSYNTLSEDTLVSETVKKQAA